MVANESMQMSQMRSLQVIPKSITQEFITIHFIIIDSSRALSFLFSFFFLFCQNLLLAIVKTTGVLRSF